MIGLTIAQKTMTLPRRGIIRSFTDPCAAGTDSTHPLFRLPRNTAIEARKLACAEKTSGWRRPRTSNRSAGLTTAIVFEANWDGRQWPRVGRTAIPAIMVVIDCIADRPKFLPRRSRGYMTPGSAF